MIKAKLLSVNSFNIDNWSINRDLLVVILDKKALIIVLLKRLTTFILIIKLNIGTRRISKKSGEWSFMQS